MKKQEIKKLVDQLKYQRTGKLTKIESELRHLEDERDLTRRMYFWSDFGNRSARARLVDRYDLDTTIKLTTDMSVRYTRDVNPSRNHAYASDSLWIERVDGTEEPFTVCDARKIADAIAAVIETRAYKKGRETR